MLEAALSLTRPDKFAITLAAVQPLILEFLEASGIEIRDLPPAEHATALALSAAHRYRAGRRGPNLGDCLHSTSAKYEGVPISATADEFREADLETIPQGTVRSTDEQAVLPIFGFSITFFEDAPSVPSRSRESRAR
ncbi:type II toxin-antitoxin system VapC family toxin [Methylobacterium sp. 17Sr1-1]|uniref:type II toxin-antitoxin system VapC family toxin n=1 Tax=Methylobacterium sp. 17Sr1-1 TaxID=2202826 RepID=UPI001FE22842|nr:type II toxin-antitoxin system VapC family toxin [Methylobacterium sp. 17Sr1-1]